MNLKLIWVYEVKKNGRSILNYSHTFLTTLTSRTWLRADVWKYLTTGEEIDHKSLIRKLLKL